MKVCYLKKSNTKLSYTSFLKVATTVSLSSTAATVQSSIDTTMSELYSSSDSVLPTSTTENLPITTSLVRSSTTNANQSQSFTTSEVRKCIY